MASVSSVISLAVLLLATYCYSVPIVTDYDYTTAGYEFATGAPMVVRESMPFTLPEEYTTIYSTINHKREGEGDHKDSSESDEISTEQSMTDDGQDKLNTLLEVTIAPFEVTPMSNKRSNTDEHHFGDYTTEYSMIKDGHQKRYNSMDVTSSPFESSPMINEQSAHMGLFGEMTTERSFTARDLEGDSFTTIESNTDFNNQVGQMGERETVDMDMTTVFEPTSSFESFTEATGFINARDVVEPMQVKVEVEKPDAYVRKTETILPGKVTKTVLTSDGENQSYLYKETAIEHEGQSVSEGTTEENDSKTNADH